MQEIKSTPESLKLFQKVLAAEEYHEKKFVIKARESERLFRGDLSYLPGKWNKDKAINANMIFSTIRNYVPALYPQQLKVYVKPSTPDWGEPAQDNVLSAFLMQNALDKYHYNLDWETTEKQSSLCSLVQGLSYAWVSWVTEKGNYNPTIVKDCPALRYVSGIDLIPDPDCINFEDKSFVARVFGKRSDQSNDVNIKGNKKSSSEKSISYLSGVNDKELNMNMPNVPKYYEVYDKNTEKIYIMSGTYGTGLLHRVDDFDITRGFPFVPLMYNPMIDNYYPMSMVEVIANMQKILTILLNWLSEHTRRALPKIVYFEDCVDKKAKQKLTDDVDMGLVGLSRKSLGENIRIDDVIKTLNAPNMPQEFGMTVSLIRDFINILSGVPQNARGGAEVQKTATEASLMDTYLRSRYADYKSITDKFVIKSRRKIIEEIKENATTDEFLRFNEKELSEQYFYSNPAFQQAVTSRGGQSFIKWNNKEVSGKYDLEVGVGSGLPTNEEFEYKKALNNLNIMARDPWFNQDKVHEHFMNGLKIPNPDQWKAKPEGPRPPEQPKTSISINFADVPTEAQDAILQEYNLLPKGSMGPQAQQPNGQQGAPGGPLDSGLMAEFNVPGLQTPPAQPEG
jgi:hypothetical protein